MRYLGDVFCQNILTLQQCCRTQHAPFFPIVVSIWQRQSVLKYLCCRCRPPAVRAGRREEAEPHMAVGRGTALRMITLCRHERGHIFKKHAAVMTHLGRIQLDKYKRSRTPGSAPSNQPAVSERAAAAVVALETSDKLHIPASLQRRPAGFCVRVPRLVLGGTEISALCDGSTISSSSKSHVQIQCLILETIIGYTKENLYVCHRVVG